jgi:PmbA protein
MDIQTAVDFLSSIAAKSAASQFDILAGSSRSQGLSVFQGKVQNTEISESVGIGIRAFRGTQPGYAFTERFTEAALAQTLSDALSHCEFTEPLPIELPMPQSLGAPLPTYNKALDALSLETLTRTCLDIEAATLARSAEIENIPYLGADLTYGLTVFANHRGVRHEQRSNAFSVGIGAVARRGETKKMGVYNKGGRDFSVVSPAQIAEIAATRSLELLGARPIVGGKMPVVFSERITGSLLGMFLSAFYADTAQKGLSRLQGKVGESIAAPLFQMRCDPFRPDLPGSELIDGEGVVPQAFDVVREGVLQSLLYNLESAAKEKRTSTGNASRGYSGKVGTAFSNCIVAPGALSVSQLLGQFSRCLYVVKLEGGSGCSAVSGEISIGAQGFWCENGVPVHPVEGITLSANFFDLLQGIVGVGDSYNDQFSSLRVPALAVQEMAVSC